MSLEKENFLRTKLIHCLQQLDPATPPRWGKMSVQQMIEHLALDAFANANGRLKFDKYAFPPEEVQRFREFMMTEKPFKENIKNPYLKEEPRAVKYNTIQAAIGSLQQEIIRFFEVFEQDHQLIIFNPFFGELNFEENVQLLHKHAIHHLRQFGIEPLSS